MEPRQRVDFRTLPKIELHAHLTGSISRECLHDVWLDLKSRGETELRDPLEVMPVGKFDYDLDTFFPLFSTYIYALCSTLPAIIFTTNRVLSDFQADGVVYLELRTTPRALPSASITKEQYITTILTCIQTFNSNPTTTMKTNLILSIDRLTTPETALSTANLAIKHKNQGIVALDLCGNPEPPIQIAHFKQAFNLAKNAGLQITLHFAESKSSSHPDELWSLLNDFKPDRLGHVIHVSEDVKREIVERGLGLEFCVSCNVHAKMIVGGVGGHHFGGWWGRGCGIALSTDDVGVFGSALSNEYRLVAEHFGLGDKEVVELARGVIDLIFGGEEEKERLRGIMWK